MSYMVLNSISVISKLYPSTQSPEDNTIQKSFKNLKSLQKIIILEQCTYMENQFKQNTQKK